MSTDFADFIRCLSRLEKVHDQDGWTNPVPALYALHCNKSGRNVRPLHLGMLDSFWSLGPPGAVMGGIAKYISLNAATTGMLRPFKEYGRWCGMAVVMEVWTGDSRSPGGYEQLIEDAKERRVSTRADRRSARVVYGMTREMMPGFLMRYEDTPHEQIDRSDESFPGGILHGLSELVATIDELLDHA